jgi:predicted membrane-bound spermidine synthase
MVLAPEGMMFTFPWWLSFFVGFLSLSQEILWVRILGFSYGGLPQAFSFVLACYLLGVAFGAAVGKRLCANSKNLYAAAAMMLAAAALFDALLPKSADLILRPYLDLLGAQGALIIISAGLKSTLFPIVHHLGSTAVDGRVARSMSRIYFGNILGSALGPLVTGFIALDRLSVDDCFAISAAACLILAAVCAVKSASRALQGVTVGAALAAGAIALPLPGINSSALAALALGGTTHLVANRNGVIHTVRRPYGDAIYGGNMYDGVAAVDVDRNPNRLDRLYVLGLLHQNPQHVLVVGMSTGAWTRAIEGFPTVTTIDVVEINPAYLALTRGYPELAPLLHDNRLRVHIDDGRRWLKRHPDSKFDLIVQNTTFHFRANASNLLSREYFLEVKKHLRPGGILTTNTTGSYDVLATGNAVFAYAYRYANFLYASDTPLTPVLRRLESVRRPDGVPFSLESPVREGSVVDLLSKAKLDPAGSFIARGPVTAEIITDDNMLTEYRHGMQFLPGILDARVRRPLTTFATDAP